jgi:hypothetical protein
MILNKSSKCINEVLNLRIEIFIFKLDMFEKKRNDIDDEKA